MWRMTQDQIFVKKQISNNKKNTTKLQIITFASLGSILFAVSGLGLAWADAGQNVTGDIVIKATPAIKNDPGMMKVLYNIELFKQRYAAMQQRQQVQDQQQQFIEQQRKIANAYLQSDLAGINLSDENNPRIAYANFVSTVDNASQSLFWGQFTYMQDKVLKARLAMNAVIQNGGNALQAMQAYNNAASIEKTEMVSVNKDLNVKYHLANPVTQDLFNKYGDFIKYNAS